MATDKMFDKKLERGDLVGAIDQSILEAARAEKAAQQSIARIELLSRGAAATARAALEKYPLL